jgi:heterodisulfide reductase subunit B
MMPPDPASLDFSYFPGCSLATTAWESNHSLLKACRLLGFHLHELEDWNCCGSSSASALDPELGLNLAARNLSLAPADRPLLVMCPRCLYYLRQTHRRLQEDPLARRRQERRWGRPISPHLVIMHFLEALVKLGLRDLTRAAGHPLKGLRFVPYYGCTLYRPHDPSRHKYYQGEVENLLTALGGTNVPQALTHRCCGSFLSAVRPQVVTTLVNEIITSAAAAEADCLVTACAMCQLNLELRSTIESRLPIFHFSEILALALGAEDYEDWFTRHLVDPRPLLHERGLIA